MILRHQGYGKIQLVLAVWIWCLYQRLIFLLWNAPSKEPVRYSGDLNTNQLNTKNIWITSLDRYKWKQDGIYLSGMQMVGLSSIQIAFEYWTIWRLTFLDQWNTKLVPYSDLHCTTHLWLVLKYNLVKPFCTLQDECNKWLLFKLSDCNINVSLPS